MHATPHHVRAGVTTMKAMTGYTYGAPEELELRDIDKPTMGDDDVLLRVHAAGVDPGVWHLVTGVPYLLRLAGFGLRRPKNPVPGMDVAGRVEAVGVNVTTFRPGDEVFGTCDGAYAEYARARQDRLAPKPASLTFAQAATVPGSACAAPQGLRDTGKLQAGQRVLVTGAGGGVGTFAVQLAKAFGAHVTGVCRTGKIDLVRSIGADDVVDHTREDFTDRVGHYDLILDTTGTHALARLRRALTPRGTLVMIGGAEGGRWLHGTDRLVRAMLLSPFVGQHLRGVLTTTPAEDLHILTELIDAGTVTPILDSTYPLGEVPDAIRHLKSGLPAGKIAITV